MTWDPTVPATGVPLQSAPVRDNFAAIDAAIMAALAAAPAGSVVYVTAAHVFAVVPGAANGYVLSYVSGVPTWVTAPGFASPMTTLGDLIMGGGSPPGPAFVNSASTGQAIVDGTVTTTITVGTGGNYLLFLAAATRYFATVPSITSITVTRVGGGAAPTFTPILNGVYQTVSDKLFVWGAVGAVPGDQYQIAVAWAGNLDVIQSVLVFGAVNQTTPTASPVTDLDGGATGSATVVTGGPTALCVDVFVGRNISAFTPGGGQTAIYGSPLTQDGIGFQASYKSGAGSVAMTQTQTNNNGVAQYAALALLPGAGVAAGTPQRLGIGTAGQVLTVAFGQPSWATPFANPMTTAGDLIIGGASGAGGRLAIGATGALLAVVAGAPAWVAKPTGTVRLAIAAADLPDGTGTINNPPELVREISVGTQTTNAPKRTRTFAKFDAATDEHLSWGFQVPPDYGSGGTIRLKWKAATATSGAVVWKAAFCAAVDSSTDDDAIVFATVGVSAAGTAPATQGQIVEATITLTMTNAAANRDCTIFIGRDADAAGDTMTGDAILVSARFEYTPA